MILIIGGIKSGKSSWASALATERESHGPVIYLATARAGDAEMADRIRCHQTERPATWTTVEEPDNPAGFFHGPNLDIQSGTVILDCITLWLTNILTSSGEIPPREESLALGKREGHCLMEAVLNWEQAASAGARETLIISNHVETGLISTWPLGRIFQDITGLTHQMFAAEASQVYLMTAGIPQKLK